MWDHGERPLDFRQISANRCENGVAAAHFLFP
jgi:hypothetical protein